MHSSLRSPDRHTRLRNLLVASIVVVASSTTLIWQQPTGVVLAKSKVPFRFMEATILETQEALAAGTVTSEVVQYASRALRPTTRRVRQSRDDLPEPERAGRGAGARCRAPDARRAVAAAFVVLGTTTTLLTCRRRGVALVGGHCSARRWCWCGSCVKQARLHQPNARVRVSITTISSLGVRR